MKVYYYNFIIIELLKMVTREKSENQSKKKTYDIPGNKDKNDNRLPIGKNSSQRQWYNYLYSTECEKNQTKPNPLI